MSRTYYLRQGNEVSGPVLAQQLREMAANGSLCETDYVRATDQDKRYVAGGVKGLFPDTVRSSHPARPLAPAPRKHSSPTPIPPTDSRIDIEAFERERKRRRAAHRKRTVAFAIAGGLIIVIVVVVVLSRRSPTNELSREKPASGVAAQSATHVERGGTDDARLAERNTTATYVLLRDEVTTDTAIRGQIEIDLLVDAPMSKDDILEVLRAKFNEAIRRRVFRQREYANCVVVSAFSSIDHYRAESYHRLAWIMQVPADDNPRIEFNDVLHKQLYDPPETKHRLSQPKRREIYMDYVHADSRAWEEAEKEYPTEPDLLVKAGDSFHIIEPLMLMGQNNAEEWFAQGAPSMKLSAGTEIKIIQTVKNDQGTKYTQVAAYPPNERNGYEGWVVTYALGAQYPILKDKDRFRRQLELRDARAQKLKKTYIAMVLKAHGIGQDVLELIDEEGSQEQWPY